MGNRWVAVLCGAGDYTLYRLRLGLLHLAVVGRSSGGCLLRFHCNRKTLYLLDIPNGQCCG